MRCRGLNATCEKGARGRCLSAPASAEHRPAGRPRALARNPGINWQDMDAAVNVRSSERAGGSSRADPRPPRSRVRYWHSIDRKLVSINTASGAMDQRGGGAAAVAFVARCGCRRAPCRSSASIRSPCSSVWRRRARICGVAFMNSLAVGIGCDDGADVAPVKHRAAVLLREPLLPLHQRGTYQRVSGDDRRPFARSHRS